MNKILSYKEVIGKMDEYINELKDLRATNPELAKKNSNKITSKRWNFG